jgi:hypothetical protein
MADYKVSNEIAVAEVNYWLDAKKIKPSQREEQKDSIEILTEAIMDGSLTLDQETNVFKYQLLFPLLGESPILDLTFKFRLNDSMVKPYLANVKHTDLTGMINAYICALTGKATGIINTIDSSDKKVARAIAAFFL